MDIIKFNNGEEHGCTFLSTIPEDNRAYIAIEGVTLAEAAAIFGDPEKTARMEWNGHVLEGYTELHGIYKQPYGWQAVLNGGHVIPPEVNT